MRFEILCSRKIAWNARSNERLLMSLFATWTCPASSQARQIKVNAIKQPTTQPTHRLSGGGHGRVSRSVNNIDVVSMNKKKRIFINCWHT